MTDPGVENGTKYEDLVQRVARLEGAVGDGRDYRSRRRSGHPWWMIWALLWLVLPAIDRFPVLRGEFGSPWGMAWPVGVLVVIGVIYYLRERDARGTTTGGRR